MSRAGVAGYRVAGYRVAGYGRTAPPAAGAVAITTVAGAAE